MTKRVVAWMLVLAMLVSVLPVGVLAEGADDTAETVIPGPDALKTHTCTDHSNSEVWTEWSNPDALPSGSVDGCFYLTEDVQLPAKWVVSANIKICLNGHKITAATANNTRIADVTGNLTIFDCHVAYEGETYVGGGLTGGTANYGAGISVKKNAEMNLYGGRLYNNNNTGEGGAVYLEAAKGNSDTGGTFNMYGGEIYDNSANFGGAVCIPGSTYTAATQATFNAYGGKIWNNTATSNGGAVCAKGNYGANVHIENVLFTGNTAANLGGVLYADYNANVHIEGTSITGNIVNNGAIYAQGGAKLLLKDTNVTGNLATSETATTTSIYIAGDGTGLTVSGKVVVANNDTTRELYFLGGNNPGLRVNALSKGSNIIYTTKNGVTTDADIAKVISLADGTGVTQNEWDCHWVTCNAEPISMVDGAFKFGHYHGTQKYTKNENGTTLHSNGYWYLAQDVVRTSTPNLQNVHYCLNGYNIRTETAGSVRLINVKGNMVIEDCTAYVDEKTGEYVAGKIMDATSTGGAAIRVYDGAVLTLEDGIITENGTSANPGAVYVADGGTFKMNGGQISDNLASHGGAVYMAAGGSFEMFGGIIKNNTADQRGGAIFVKAGTAKVRLAGGTIENNRVVAKSYGGAIHTEAGAPDVMIGGSVKIDGNYHGPEGSTEENNLRLSDSRILKLDAEYPMAEGASVSIYTNNELARYISNELPETAAQYFTTDDPVWTVIWQEGKLFYTGAHKHCVCGSTTCSGEGHAQVNWAPWTDSTKLPDSGYYYLETDVTRTAEQQITKDRNICLHGHKVRVDNYDASGTLKMDADGQRLSTISGGATVTITDCKDTGTISGGTRYYGALFSVSNATLKLYAGTITGNQNTTGAGAIYLKDNGAFYMYGGQISDNHAGDGAAVGIDTNGGTVYMHGGTITDNHAAGSGGAIHANAGGTVYIYGGTVTGNTAVNNGGGICVAANAELYLHGGSITGNTTQRYGGGVYANSNAAMVSVQGDVVIKDNKANAIGSNLHLAGSAVMTLGEITSADGSIGISGNGDIRAISRETAKQNAAKFFVDDEDRSIIWNYDEQTQKGDKRLWFGFEHQHPQDHPKCQHALEGWRPWEKTDSLPTGSGNYYLTGDVVLTKGCNSPANLKICLNGFTIKQTGENQRIMTVESGDTVTITDCRGTGVITGGTRTFGAAFSVASGGTLNLYGGKITGNANADEGGAVYIASAKMDGQTLIPGGIFNMYGGEISGNRSARGGAVAAAAAKADGKPAQFNLYGGTVKENIASEKGGAVYVHKNGQTFFGGGAITGNKASQYGGAVYVEATAGKTQVMGNVQITGNKVADREDNLYLLGEAVVTVGTMGADAKIGISASASRFVSTQLTEAAAKAFIADSSNYALTVREEKLYYGTLHVHCLEGDSECTHEQIAYEEWNDPTKLPGSGNYFLNTDVTLHAAASISKQLNLCLNGHTVKVEQEEGKDARRVMDVSAKVAISDCAQKPGKITGGTRDYGAAFSVKTGAELSIYGGIITGNSNKADAGAIYVTNGAVCNMYGGEISGNTARTGGAVYVAKTGEGQKNGQFNLYGGTITGNTATKRSGAIHGDKGAQILLAGGEITGNTAGNNGGAIYMAKDMGKLTVQGSVVVDNNKLGEKENNIYLENTAILEIGALQSGAKIGLINNGEQIAVSGKTTKEMSAFFSSDNGYRTVVLQGDVLYLTAAGEHTHCTCANQLSGCDHSGNAWAAWEKTNSLPTADGCYYLLSDVTLTGAAQITGNVTLCLNGHTVTIQQKKDETGNVISGKDGLRIADVYGALTITDCATTDGLLTGGNRDYGAAFSVKGGATLNWYGGKLTGNRNETDGGAVYLANGAIFNQYGGEISGNQANAGGAISAAKATEGKTPAQVNLYGGTLSGNMATRGGAVYIYQGAQLNIAGGQITGNSAELYGGAVYMQPESTIVMTGGSMSGNQAESLAGALYTGMRTAVKLSGGEITGNTGVRDGGAIYALASDIELSGEVKISGNVSAKGAGGGICLAANVKDGKNVGGMLTMIGGEISGNTSQNSGGGIYIQRGEAAITGGKISGNTANGNGGGVYFAGCKATLANVEISENKAVKDAGGFGAGRNEVAINDEKVAFESEITVKDGTKLTGNTANNAGAIITYAYTVLNIEGGEFTKNTAAKNAGGIFINTNGTVNISGGKIANNTSKSGSGGGLYVTNAKATISGVTITGNKCVKYGGGIYGYKADLTMTSGTVSGNYSDESGGGMSFSKDSVVTIHGGAVRNNTVKSSAAGILLMSGSKLNLKGGTVSGNEAPGTGGGVYLTANCVLNMSGGKVMDNSAVKSGGGIYINTAEANITGGEVTGNYAGTGGGGAYFTRATANVSNLLIKDNKADNSGAGLIYSRSSGTVENTRIEGNEGYAGAGMLVQLYSDVTGKNLVITGNTANQHSGGGVYVYSNAKLQLIDSEITNNTAVEDGGGIYMHAPSSLNDKRSYLTTDNVTVSGNTSGRNGGGMYIDYQMYATLENSKIADNTAAVSGGGIYGSVGSGVTALNTDITGNSCAETGSALYGGYHVSLLGGTISGNKTKNGAAVYLTPGNYDGHSYISGKVKFAGDLRILDNEGTQADLYIDEGKVIGTTAEGFGKNTEIHLQLHSGVLTGTLMAAYNYEGGNCLYTVTYGDRSMKEQETVPAEEIVEPTEGTEGTKATEPANETGLLYAGVGAFAVVIAAVAVIVVLVSKKKKAGKAAEEVSEN